MNHVIVKSLAAVLILIYSSTGCLIIRDKEAEKEYKFFSNMHMCMMYTLNRQIEEEILSDEAACYLIWLINDEMDNEKPLIDSPYKFSF